MALYWLPNDDQTDIKVVRTSGTGFAQADPTRKSHRKKHPLGFVSSPPKPKPKGR